MGSLQAGYKTIIGSVSSDRDLRSVWVRQFCGNGHCYQRSDRDGTEEGLVRVARGLYWNARRHWRLPHDRLHRWYIVRL